MSRYIDADVLIDKFCGACATPKRYQRTFEDCRNKTDSYGNRCFKMRLIDTTPTADVVEVEEYKDQLCELNAKIYELQRELETARATTVRKMQERLHERKVSYGNIKFRVVPIDDIDQIAKEMVEDLNRDT